MSNKWEWWEVHHEDCDCTMKVWPPGDRCASLRVTIQQEIERRCEMTEGPKDLTDEQIDEEWMIARQRPVAHRRLARRIETILRDE